MYSRPKDAHPGFRDFAQDFHAGLALGSWTCRVFPSCFQVWPGPGLPTQSSRTFQDFHAQHIPRALPRFSRPRDTSRMPRCSGPSQPIPGLPTGAPTVPGFFPSFPGLGVLPGFLDSPGLPWIFFQGFPGGCFPRSPSPGALPWFLNFPSFPQFSSPRGAPRVPGFFPGLPGPVVVPAFSDFSRTSILRVVPGLSQVFQVSGCPLRVLGKFHIGLGRRRGKRN